ncbi:MAG: glycosyltransferase [Terriglobia bacterium]
MGLTEYVKVLGYLDRVAVADCLAAADVCILPFRDGLHPKSTSFLAAKAQGTYIVTTSRQKTGLDESCNVYYASPGNVDAMEAGVARRTGRRPPRSPAPENGWHSVAEQHVSLYSNLLARSRVREGNACSARA